MSRPICDRYWPLANGRPVWESSHSGILYISTNCECELWTHRSVKCCCFLSIVLWGGGGGVHLYGTRHQILPLRWSWTQQNNSLIRRYHILHYSWFILEGLYLLPASVSRRSELSLHRIFGCCCNTVLLRSSSRGLWFGRDRLYSRHEWAEKHMIARWQLEKFLGA
jgi:hypothetical protein